MSPKEPISTLAKMTDFVVNAYLQDLTDADFLTRTVPGANHIAWQMGHLITAERDLLKGIPDTTPLELPAAFAEKHTKEKAAVNDANAFATKAEYLSLYQKSRANFLKCLESFPVENLSKATEGPLASIAPTLSAMFILIANHPMMHAGQFAVLRRKLGKPIVI